jgi:hypothetical protein
MKLVEIKRFNLSGSSEKYTKIFLLNTTQKKRNMFAFYLHIDYQTEINCGFEFRQGYGHVLHTVFCKVEVSAIGRSLVQNSHKECNVLLSVIWCNNNPIQCRMRMIYKCSA